MDVSVARLPGGKLGIIDLGFGGLGAWLASRPEEARLVTLMKRQDGASLSFVPDPQPPPETESSHGFDVYRVVRAILPDVPVVLYRGPNAIEAGNALLDGMVKGVVLFNISLGIPSTVDVFTDQEDLFAKQLRLYLPQYEAFAFISAGNTRQSTHAWVSADRNGNGFVDFRETAASGQSIDGARVVFAPGKNRVFFAWDSGKHPDADFELEAVAADGRSLAAARIDPRAARKGVIPMVVEVPTREAAMLRVRRLAGPAAGVFMRLGAYPSGVPEDFNGVQTALTYLHRENPFVVYVGSFGAAPNGLAPSSFSDIGANADGAILPHVLGPGQLRLDGTTLSGTSFASPFLTALYATRVGYNVKNLIERSTTMAPLAPDAAAPERSRWGVPDARKIASALKDITGPTRIDAVSHETAAEHVTIRLRVSRCCMESLTWYVGVALVDDATGAPIAGPDGKPVAAEAALRRDEKDVMNHPLEVRIPRAALAPHGGKTVRLAFSVRVRAWRAPPPGALIVDDAPVYRFAL